MIRSSIACAVFGAAHFFAQPAHAQGCTCGGLVADGAVVAGADAAAGLDARLEAADAVFSGVVSGADAFPDPADPTVFAQSTTFRILRVEKGDVGREAEVASSLEASACGLRLDYGRAYRIIARAVGDGLETDWCAWRLANPEARIIERGPRRPERPQAPPY